MATSEQPGASAGPPLVSQFVSQGSREDAYSLPCSLGLTLAVPFLFLLDGAPRPWCSFIDTCNHRYQRWLPYAETRRKISGSFLLWRSHLEGLWRISQGNMLVWFGKFSYCLLWNNNFLFAEIYNQRTPLDTIFHPAPVGFQALSVDACVGAELPAWAGSSAPEPWVWQWYRTMGMYLEGVDQTAASFPRELCAALSRLLKLSL